MKKHDKLNDTIDHLYKLILSQKEDISKIKKDQLIQSDNLDRIVEKMSTFINKKDASILCSIWIITILSFVVFALLFMYIDEKARAVIELSTSWGTVACILYFGFTASYKIFFVNKKLGLLAACAFASILTCYSAYVLIDFGSVWQDIAAIGFNVSTFLQCFAAYKVIKYCAGHNKK